MDNSVAVGAVALGLLIGCFEKHFNLIGCAGRQTLLFGRALASNPYSFSREPTPLKKKFWPKVLQQLVQWELLLTTQRNLSSASLLAAVVAP